MIATASATRHPSSPAAHSLGARHGTGLGHGDVPRHNAGPGRRYRGPGRTAATRRRSGGWRRSPWTPGSRQVIGVRRAVGTTWIWPWARGMVKCIMNGLGVAGLHVHGGGDEPGGALGPQGVEWGAALDVGHRGVAGQVHGQDPHVLAVHGAQPGCGPAMNCDWPGGVWLASVTVRVPLVRGRRDHCSGETVDTDRYWSSLLPPRLITAVMSESGASLPATPPCHPGLPRPTAPTTTPSGGGPGWPPSWRRPATRRSSDSFCKASSTAWPAPPGAPRGSLGSSCIGDWWARREPLVLVVRQASAPRCRRPRWCRRPRVTGPVTSRNWCNASRPRTITPSTCWPVSACHICAARGRSRRTAGVSPRLRQSWPGFSQPQRASRSPVGVTLPAGHGDATVGVTWTAQMWPSGGRRAPPPRGSLPDPARISALLAMTSR